MSEKIVLGRVTGVFGIRGWVKLHSDTMPRENILEYGDWWLGRDGQWWRVALRDGRPQGKTLVAQIEGVDDPDAAAALIGAEIGVLRQDLPSIAAGEYYWADLIGLDVQTVSGVAIGPVLRLFETGANDVLVVEDRRQTDESLKEVLIPWVVPDVITSVDLERRHITVDWDPDF